MARASLGFREMKLSRALTAAVGAAVLLGGAAKADDAQADEAQRGYSLFNPAPADKLRGLCTDRPTKSTGPCTVDAGHWQVESDLYNLTYQRDSGVSTTTELFTNPTLKLGLTDNLDVEANIVPFEQVTVKDHGATTRTTGAGDLYLRLKDSLVGGDNAKVAIAVSPFLKVPTAGSGLGNGAVEGGVIVPVQFALGDWQLLFDPELDVLKNAADDGRHVSAAGLVSLSRAASKAVTLSAELWTQSDFDPTGTTTQYSADLGAAWIPTQAPNLQLDTGVNLGLNRATPDVQAYVGISRRF